MAAVADPSLVNSNYVLPPDYKIMTETAEVFTKALLLGMEPEQNNFADDAPVEILPFEEALAYMRKRVPVDKETYYALNDKMRYRAFTVGRLADGDAVKRVQGMLSDALEEGSGLQKFLQMTEGQLADAAGMGRGSGWYYETVYRTNTSTAYNVGRAIAFEETPPIALELIGIDDTRQTETCHALTVPPFRRPYNDPVWQTLWPPFHYNCRTTVRAIYDEAEIEDAGGPSKFYSQGTPDYKPDKGFGAYPVDKTDKWWDLTDTMRERAKEYGVMGEFEEAREKLIEPKPISTNNLVTTATDAESIIEQSLGIKIGEPMTIEDAYKGANPDYGKVIGHKTNCQNCVAAFELRCRGFDVEALPTAEENIGWRGVEGFEKPKIIGWVKYDGDGSNLTQETLKDQLKALPDGSRCGIIIKRIEEGGHTFVSVKTKGEIKFYDPQSGNEYPDIPSDVIRGSYTYYRMDDLKLNAAHDWIRTVKRKK
jgi:SPP1 gp7 family putative phage head morphogenesis protein